MILAVCPNPSIDILAEINHFQSKSVNRFIKERHYPGGKGVHVALAIAEITGKADLLGIWAGPSGTWIQEACKSRNTLCFGPEVAGWSRSCYTFKSADASINETELLGAGPLITETGYNAFIDAFTNALPQYEIVCMSGSIPPGFPSDTYYQLMGLMGLKKAVIDCSGKALEKALERRPCCVHINRHEGKAFFNTDDPRSIARQLQERCDYAAVTNGADGLYLAHKGTIIHAHTRVDKVISAVGSGDCLTAGLAVALSRNYTPKEMAKLAVACGAANCLYEELGMLRLSDVEALVSRVETD